MFIGREDELKELKNWLERGEPCIAVTGKGGIGKTTLVKGFTSTKDFKRSSEAIYISLKGETEVVQPIKVVIERIGRGLKGKIAEWFGERWGKIEDIKIIGFELKKTSKEKIERSLKQILQELDFKLKGNKIIVVVDDMQLADDKSLRQICKLANVNWENLKWILVHREERKIREGLKDLSGWTPLGIEGLNKEDISKLFIEHANGRIEVKGIDKDAFFEVTQGYPNFIDTIVSALKERYRDAEIEITRKFIKENYDAFAKPIEFVMDNYLDEDEKLNLLSIAILKEEVTVGSIVDSFRLSINILKEFLKPFEVEPKYKKLKEFGFIEIKNEEIDIHDAKRDRIVEVMKDKEQVKRVKEAAIDYHLPIASVTNKKQDYITASSAYLHAYHHASHIDNRLMLECLVNASANSLNCGDYYFAYICSNYALEDISGLMRVDDYLTHLKLRALGVKAEALFGEGLYRYFEFDLDEIVEEVRKTFFSLKNAERKEIRKRSLEEYMKILSNIMNYFASEGKGNEIMDVLKNSQLEEEQKTTLKIHTSEKLTYLWDERGKELLEEVKDVEDIDKYRISYIEGLWSMDNFEKASKLFEESAKRSQSYLLTKASAVGMYCLAAILTSDRMRTLKMLTNAEKNLVGDVASILMYKFTDAIVSVNREEKTEKFFNELLKMQLGEEQRREYWMHYSQAFNLLDCLEGLSLDEKAESMLEKHPLNKIISSMNDRKEASRRLGDVEMLPMHKAILKGIISGGVEIENKIAKFIGFYSLTTV